MSYYEKCKIYSDSSHYIAIPHTTRPYRPRPKKLEERITVDGESEMTDNVSAETDTAGEMGVEQAVETDIWEDTPAPKHGRTMTKKQLFEELYARHLQDSRAERRDAIIFAMRPYFKTDTEAELYVRAHMERKQRNLTARRIRMTRKANLQEFNYFVTFTYDDKLHDEGSFRKKLKTALRNSCYRKSWKYMGVWERSPEKKRLHFHGIFYIPDGAFPGSMEKREDYSFITHRRQTIHESVYFAERFGRNDFEPIDDKNRLGEAITYLMKYLEKTGEKIVYSKGLPQFFISDVSGDDVVCTVGVEDKKLLLYDNFRCWDEGVLIGQVSKDVIEKLPKRN